MVRPPASAEAREQRINQLLEAAIALWQATPDRVPSVAEVASRAGVGKGTLYLYFKRKEDLLLAAHEHNTRAFFAALIERASSTEPMTLDTMMDLAREYIVNVPGFLPLANLVAGLINKGISPEAAEEFETRISGQMKSAGALLVNHFPLPDPESGVRLLMRSFALILGLWQLIGTDRPPCVKGDLADMLLPDYAAELDAALRALWSGTLNSEVPNV